MLSSHDDDIILETEMAGESFLERMGSLKQQVPSFILIGPALYRFADPHLLGGHSWAIDLASKRIAVCETWSVPWFTDYSEFSISFQES
ncbi:hypothetical protein Q9966_002700 [Columba livia]|nr:hypothetical protein Q9966_002700 [Columba livia]